MNRASAYGVLLSLAYGLCQLQADEPVARLLPPVAVTVEFQDAGGKEKAKEPDKKLQEPPKTDVFSEALLPRSEGPASFNPQMMGDFGVFFVRQAVTVTGFQTITTTTSTTTSGDGGPVTTTHTTTAKIPVSQTRFLLIPESSGGVFKVAENESPRPQDRAYVAYNYFGDLASPQNGANAAFKSTQTTNSTGVASGPFGGETQTSTATSNTSIPNTRVNANLNREVFGFEKTFLDGYASIELRLPLLQQHGGIDALTGDNVGDITIITKYAFILDKQTGNVLSGGLAITAPTGPGFQTIDGNIHSTLLQPWLGYIWNADRFYVQAFHSVVVPTDSRDVTLLFNDVSVNYWLYRGDSNRFLQFIVPTLEAHVTTPLDHRGINDPIQVPDIVVLTGGVHFGLGRNTTLSIGAATPVTGPRLFSVESFMQLNWRF